jgi:hypothetical protein
MVPLQLVFPSRVGGKQTVLIPWSGQISRVCTHPSLDSGLGCTTWLRQNRSTERIRKLERRAQPRDEGDISPVSIREARAKLEALASEMNVIESRFDRFVEPPGMFPQFRGLYGWGLDIQGIVHSNLTPSSMTQLKEVSKNLPGSHLAMKGRQIPENQSRNES